MVLWWVKRDLELSCKESEKILAKKLEKQTSKLSIKHLRTPLVWLENSHKT